MGRLALGRSSGFGLFNGQSAHAYTVFFVATIIALIILPIPPVGLDVVITINIASAVLLLMLSLYIPNAMSISTFPSLILITTALRLAVNIASTKQILLHARAGDVIETFGALVMGGQVVVGLVVFTIISVVQFIVVSKGAERVAEVGARFTLDGLPGRQMSIEADLRAELITKEEAGRLRTDLQKESQLHGALDGAMKFVKGDAVAAIIIALVNIIGGISIGTAVLGMELSEALERFTLLTVGDGMVSQIPSLMSSLAAGMLTTRIVGRGEEGSNLGGQVQSQIAKQRAALYATAAVVGSMSIIPGFPVFTFLTLAVAIAVGVWLTRPQIGDEDRQIASWQVESSASGAQQNAIGFPGQTNALDSSTVTPLQIRLAVGLRQQLKPVALHDALAFQERELTRVLGRAFPQTSVKFDSALPEHAVAIDVQELECDRWVLRPDRDHDSQPEPLIAARVANIVRLRTDAFVGTEELLAVTERFRDSNASLYGEVMRAVPPNRVLEVLRLLASEYVSLRLMREIFEALLIWAPREKDSTQLTEKVRSELTRFIVAPLLNEQGALEAVFLPQTLESLVEQGMANSGTGASGGDGVLAPDLLSRLVNELKRLSGSFPSGAPVVLLTSGSVRPTMRKLIEPMAPGVRLLSYSSLPSDTVVVPVGQIEIDEPKEADRVTEQQNL